LTATCRQGKSLRFLAPFFEGVDKLHDAITRLMPLY